jgi:hypothetical protein
MLAGVSKATASRAMANSPLVRERPLRDQGIRQGARLCPQRAPRPWPEAVGHHRAVHLPQAAALLRAQFFGPLLDGAKS